MFLSIESERIRHWEYFWSHRTRVFSRCPRVLYSARINRHIVSKTRLSAGLFHLRVARPERLAEIQANAQSSRRWLFMYSARLCMFSFLAIRLQDWAVLRTQLRARSLEYFWSTTGGSNNFVWQRLYLRQNSQSVDQRYTSVTPFCTLYSLTSGRAFYFACV